MAEVDNPNGVSRRGLLKTTGTAALFAAVQQAFPSGAFAAGVGPEVTGAKLGFIALTDAAPLIIAKELGFFAKYGMPDVQVAKQASWGATRDNLVLGSAGGGIDGGGDHRGIISRLLRPRAVHSAASGAGRRR